MSNHESSTVVGAAVVGAACGGILMVASRGRFPRTNTALIADQTASVSKMMRDMTQALRRDIHQDISKEVEESLLTTTNHFVTSLQSQEREIGKRLASHYQIIQDRLVPIQSVRQELQTMTLQVEHLVRIFTSPKRRGTFGELHLEAIICDAMHQGSYDFQYTLSNGKRPDCILYLPSPIGSLAIDSKFPLESFLELNECMEQTSSENNTSRPDSEKALRLKVEDSFRKHIKDIAYKYIIPGETADCAILFLPSESLFAQLVQDFPAIWQEANRHRVWIACPTTLMAVLTTLRGVVRGMSLQQKTADMRSEIGEMLKDVDRLVRGTEKYSSDAQNIVDVTKKNLRSVKVWTRKIQRRKLNLDRMDASTAMAVERDITPQQKEVESGADTSNEKVAMERSNHLKSTH